MPDRFAHLTDGQRRAILARDRSILVSAAAGSGKTTVLAERCAALVCDDPPGRRCGIDELLVVTFTDAAAGEMKARIAAAIRRRIDEAAARGRRDPWLAEQLCLLDGASISTIHAFCRTVIQRWFPQAGIDPQAAVLDAQEAQLLREEVLDAYFTELYAGADEGSLAFQQLIDDYGAGNDWAIAQTVLSLHDYISSLPDPQAWLQGSLDQIDPDSPASVIRQLDRLQHERLTDELRLQIDYTREAAETIRRCWSVAEMHAHSLDEHRKRLEGWLEVLAGGETARAEACGSWERAEAWSAVAAEICDADLKFGTRAPTGLSGEVKAAFAAAKDVRDRTMEVFKRRVREACCRFTADEYREGLERTTPYTRTLVTLVREFDRRYRDAKDAQAVVDFNDLQRCTLRVLADEQGRPTDAARHLQQQYKHVLVDEFQDVDPLQEAILRLASRESARPPEGNLFAVGDIKQSIYRFRLAEPDLFANRADRFRACGARGSLDCPGELIHLRENFRSRESIIDAVNLIFRPLMSRAFGGSDYDDNARLVAAARFATDASGPTFDRPAVELHLLEPITQSTASDDDEGDGAESSDTAATQADLDGLEREAWLIATRIQEWMGKSLPIADCRLPIDEEAAASPDKSAFQNPVAAAPHSGRAPARRRCHTDLGMPCESKTGNRKSEMFVSGRPLTPDGPPQARPIEYRDIVILLRSLQHKAAPMADILRRMGVPVRIDRDEGGLDGTEFNDVLSLLHVLDNQQQDIPLAAVLRSPILGEPFNETQLLEIRLLDREIPFHQAVVRYAAGGTDTELRERLAETLGRIARYRRRMQQAPVAEVLWEIYSETAYLAYVCGLPDGLRRRQNLIRLHDLARQFGQFSRQGLRRFLRFVEDMRERESLSLGPASAGPEENVVRIMTIHASKGLEFPVVIVADLQKTFNLTDTRSTVLLDRRRGIALRAADAERRILYPTLLHQLAAGEGTRESLSEELRVLYVALTRAREHLLLVGRTRLEKVASYRTLHAAGDCPQQVPPLQLQTAQCVLDWLLPALCTMPRTAIRWPDEPHGQELPLFEVHMYGRATTDTWAVPPAVRPERVDALARLARLEPLPADEPPTVARSDDGDPILAVLSDHYPHLELTTVPARSSATELKRRWDAQHDPLERVREPVRRLAGYEQPRTLVDDAGHDAAARGTATHRFLQWLDLARVFTASDLQAQLDEFIAAGRFTPAEAGTVMLDACDWFLQTDLGRRVRAAAACLRRELPFVARIPPSDLDPVLVARDVRDSVLIRGVIDVLLDDGRQLEILDYKTDAIEAAACPERAAHYRPQIDSYARAIEGIYRRNVTHRRLVFLHGRCIVDCTPPPA